jgi:hypothetical protein
MQEEIQEELPASRDDKVFEDEEGLMLLGRRNPAWKKK